MAVVVMMGVGGQLWRWVVPHQVSVGLIVLKMIRRSLATNMLIKAHNPMAHAGYDVKIMGDHDHGTLSSLMIRRQEMIKTLLPFDVNTL